METIAPPVKETKAQKAERLKRAKNPWECLEEIRSFARQGHDSIPAEWGTYFRWWGIYSQGDGLGVVGGSGGEGKAVPYFMVRIRIANGQLFSHQLRVIAELAEQYARGVADITVRQNVQLHWVPVEALPDIIERLWRCGLTTTGACGDVTRNITGCPVAGVDAEEICDASPLVHQTARMLVGNSEFYNLPRKYKISITGCRSWCNYPEINDIGITAVRRVLHGEPEVGFSVRVGGGLSTDPFLAQRLPAFVQRHQVPAVVDGISRVFRDADCLREKRERARLKYLFIDHGWTAESFLQEVESRIGYRLDSPAEEEVPNDVYRDHVGVHPQKQEGYYYVGASVLRGRITPQQMRAAADLAERHAAGELRCTGMQNLVVVNVPKQNLRSLTTELELAGLPVSASPFWRGAIACTGTEFCKLAITETKGFTHWLVGELDERMPGFDAHLKIHVTGCPNSCGQHWIADLGLEGKKIKHDGEMVDAYYFSVGGALGQHAGFTRKVGYRCSAVEVPDAIERLLRRYQRSRLPGENLRAFFARHREDEIKEFLTAPNAVAERPLREPARELVANGTGH